MVNTAFQVPPALAPAPLPRWALAAVVLLALLNLLAALGGGLVRLGTLPAGAVGPTGPQAVATHGALLMAGFFGTLIALERAVALHRGLWVPALAGLGDQAVGRRRHAAPVEAPGQRIGFRQDARLLLSLAAFTDFTGQLDVAPPAEDDQRDVEQQGGGQQGGEHDAGHGRQALVEALVSASCSSACA